MMDKDKGRDANRDPISGEPKSHPVGTGVGAAAGGAAGVAAGAAAGAATGTVAGGPVGTAVGAVAGAVLGAAAGHSAAEGLNPTNSVEEGRYIDYTVIDRDDQKVGTVESVWLDSSGDPAYLSIKTGWLGLGRTVVVPAQSANVSQRSRQIRLPYTLEQIKGSPAFDSSANLQTADEDRIGSYYGAHCFKREGWLEQRQQRQGQTAARDTGGNRKDEARVQLKEEEVKVGKREVEYGGVRLRKVVRTEVVNQPVELKREEIVIERVPAKDARATDTDFAEEDIYVPLRREEAVVAKEARVREEVRLGKRQERETQTVSETVRKEDVEIEKNIPESRLDATGQRARTEKYQPKERSRSS
jgi:uncharacterized protein (TIGR02271 family)